MVGRPFGIGAVKASVSCPFQASTCRCATSRAFIVFSLGVLDWLSPNGDASGFRRLQETSVSRGVRRNALVKVSLSDNKEGTALPIWCNYTLVVVNYHFGTTGRAEGIPWQGTGRLGPRTGISTGRKTSSQKRTQREDPNCAR